MFVLYFSHRIYIVGGREEGVKEIKPLDQDLDYKTISLISGLTFIGVEPYITINFTCSIHC